MKNLSGLAFGICIGTLALATPASARMTSALGGSLYGNPTATNDYVSSSGGSVINNTGNPNRLGWSIPLSIDNVGTQAPVVSAAGDDNAEFGVQPTICRGHRINQDGTIYASTAYIEWDTNNISVAQTLPSAYVYANQTYLVGCWLSQLGGKLNTVQYTP